VYNHETLSLFSIINVSICFQNSLAPVILLPSHLKNTLCKLGTRGLCLKSCLFRGRDQEDCSSKSAWVNSSWDPICKYPITKNGDGEVAQAEDLELKPQYNRNQTKPSQTTPWHFPIYFIVLKFWDHLLFYKCWIFVDVWFSSPGYYSSQILLYTSTLCIVELIPVYLWRG
jgi:hypothetical protein